MEHITDVDYQLEKRVCKGFEINNLGEYHEYLQSNASSSTDVFENFLSMCLGIFELDRARFLTAKGLVW